MTTDRELLELAAKAAGIDLHWNDREESGYYENYRGLPQWVEWNALHDDGDALRLAVKLGLQFDFGNAMVTYPVEVCGEGLDHDVATRRAIVRAAAEISKAMP